MGKYFLKPSDQPHSSTLKWISIFILNALDNTYGFAQAEKIDLNESAILFSENVTITKGSSQAAQDLEYVASSISSGYERQNQPVFLKSIERDGTHGFLRCFEKIKLPPRAGLSNSLATFRHMVFSSLASVQGECRYRRYASRDVALLLPDRNPCRGPNCQRRKAGLCPSSPNLGFEARSADEPRAIGWVGHDSPSELGLAWCRAYLMRASARLGS